MYEWLPFLAAGAMAMSSVSVVSNSLLLGRYRPRFAAEKPEEMRVYPEAAKKMIYAPQPEEAASTTQEL
jgi:Cu+-exporting ATPase